MREAEAGALSVVEHEVVEEDEGGHGFDDRDGSRKYAGVMTAGGLDGGGVAVGVYSLLLLGDGGGGFECDAEVDFHAVGDAALDAAGVVGCGLNILERMLR